jgi:NitT/TauT family transport system ATP-binding protein
MFSGTGCRDVLRLQEAFAGAKERPARAPGRVTEVAIMRSAAGFVAIEGVALSYGRKDPVFALDGLDIAVERGGFIAVVGPSGCGKSSLMKLVTGLLVPDAGTISVGGAEVTGPLKIAGMAFQNPTLLPWRTVLSNVVLPFEVVDEHRAKVRTQRGYYEDKARALLRAVGLEGIEHRYPWQLSGGMQQRVSLCRALVHEPALLLLDEPFGALDAFTREELWDVLQSLWLARKFTTILVTHDLREAVYLADKVFVISRRPGHVVATHEVPIERPRRPETLFQPAFIDIVHTLRREIAEQLNKDAPVAAAQGAP